MSRSCRASEVFKELPNEIKEQVFQMGARKLVYFPTGDPRKPVEKTAVCKRYAEGLSFAKAGSEFSISRERAFKIVAEERAVFSKDRTRYCRDRGLSLRQITRLFKKSHEVVS